MSKILNKLISLSLFALLFSCSSNNSIYLTKLKNSPSYENSKLTLKDLITDEDDYLFNFEIDEYMLGEQTKGNFEFQIANSAQGQHIHYILNNGPYSAHYENSFKKTLNKENNIVLAFLSRSYHESVKNKDAYFIGQFGEEKIDLSKEFLFYSRPKGTYTGADTERILLDFYLINNTLSHEGNRVRATINDEEFFIYEWSPYIINGLPKGETIIKLELLDNQNNLIENPFNPTTRTIILE
ncbi:MAG: hypothetical protein VYE52_01930 [Bacteroidota bacterium]|nr:hypothetical protein [Bacteroidota bacterium]